MSRFGGIVGVMALGAVPALGGCGYVTPTLQENRTDTVAGQQLVESIAYNVTCEVQDAIYKIYNNPDHPRKTTFLDTWGVQIALNLQVDEKSSLNPEINWLPPNPPRAIFNLLFGGTLSGEATRQDKLNSYHTIEQIKALGPCDAATRPGGILLMQSDLGLTDWLRDNVTAADTGVIQYASDFSDSPLKTNVISHEIKFDVVTIGNINPAWILTRFLVNQAGNVLLSASRDRTNDLTITLGPTVPTPAVKLDAQGQPLKDALGNVVTTTTYVPSAPAAAAALSSQIGLAVSNALKGTLQP